MVAARRWIVLGTGLLGDALAAELAHRGVPHIALDHKTIDAAGGISAAAARELRGASDIVVNAAAMTNLDACEERPADAMRVNGEEPGLLARAVRAHAGARLVHISTDNVLDVVNAYARGKELGERRVREELGDDALILRISTVFGPHARRSDFVRFVVTTLREKGEVTALTDMRSSPTYTLDAARAIVAAVDGGARGTQQFVNEPDITRYEFARAIQATWRAPGVVNGIPMSEFKGWKAPRAKATVISTTLGAWHKPMALQACLEDYRARWP